MKRFLIITLIFLCSNLVKAQPGWQDFTGRYYYTILGNDGKEISFKNNQNYSIMIDNVLYKKPNIPQDSLKRALKTSYGFEDQIRINDFALAIPQKNFNSPQKQLEIKIIHKRDTLSICQRSGTGSFPINDFQGKPIKSKSDFTLQFIPGHYFFPSWAKNLLDKIPATNGEVKIVNLDQRHFIVPKVIYDSICYSNPIYPNGQKHAAEAENLVVKNFMKGFFTFKRNVQSTKFDKSLRPYSGPRWSTWGDSYFSTSKKDEYLGVVSLSYDTLNYS